MLLCLDLFLFNLNGMVLAEISTNIFLAFIYLFFIVWVACVSVCGKGRSLTIEVIGE